ncbi:MAG: hypothetical protein J5691_00900 [Bacilli bacterium]|nr:hypothetical protein [Bacilli bacterium]
MRKNKVYKLGEYLSEHMTPEDIIFVDNIANHYVGKCIWLEQGNGKSLINRYMLPCYIIKEVDVDNSTLIVNPIKATALSKERDSMYNEWTTFKYDVVTNKTKTLKLGLVEAHLLKIGCAYVNSYNVRDTDLTKPDKTLTRENPWD